MHMVIFGGKKKPVAMIGQAPRVKLDNLKELSCVVGTTQDWNGTLIRLPGQKQWETVVNMSVALTTMLLALVVWCNAASAAAVGNAFSPGPTLANPRAF